MGYATKGWPRPSRVPRPVWWLVRRPVNAVSSSLTIGGLRLTKAWLLAQEYRHRAREGRIVS